MTAATTEHTIATTSVPADAAHIVMEDPSDVRTAQAIVLEARIFGLTVMALCGYVWVPQKDPKPLPVCEACLAIYHQPGENRDDREELPDA